MELPNSDLRAERVRSTNGLHRLVQVAVNDRRSVLRLSTLPLDLDCENSCAQGLLRRQAMRDIDAEVALIHGIAIRQISGISHGCIDRP